MEPVTFITIATALRELTRAKHCTKLLTPEAIYLLTRFKNAYDGKDIESLSRCFASRIAVDFYGAESRDGLIAVFDDLFGKLNYFVSPSLAITVYAIVEDTEKTFEAELSFNSACLVGGIPIPFANFATGKANCRIEQCGKGRTQWQITKLVDKNGGE